MKATDEYAKADDSSLRVALIIHATESRFNFFLSLSYGLSIVWGLKKKKRKKVGSSRLNSDYNYPRDRIISLLIALCYNRRVD